MGLVPKSGWSILLLRQDFLLVLLCLPFKGEGFEAQKCVCVYVCVKSILKLANKIMIVEFGQMFGKSGCFWHSLLARHQSFCPDERLSLRHCGEPFKEGAAENFRCKIVGRGDAGGTWKPRFGQRKPWNSCLKGENPLYGAESGILPYFGKKTVGGELLEVTGAGAKYNPPA